ncbi:hypothetical protein VTN77DRAFT_257 [Rasamsonia byssochlamydoides]|uniref:uncharacterized protein n=1 Tax=Rasamsonia byssochlamydoides TaxID=89139 RepID=UPI0037445D9C
MATSTPVREGSVPFTFPTLPSPAQTWYRVYGNLDPGNPAVVPLVVLHGGPGACHDYMVPLADLASSIPVILYDQIGNGRSTHYPEKKGDGAFWSVDLFIAELENLLQQLGISDRFDILGHSWGGMLGAEFAIRQPAGLRRLILSNAPADVGLWREAVNRLRETLPADVQNVLKKCEEEGQTESEEYQDAVMAFMARFVCRLDPWPQGLQDSADWMVEKDPTVYLTANGPSEFYIVGSLKDWSIVDSLHKIKTPTLLINGRYDEAQDSVVEPFFRKLDKVTWVTFAESAHMPHWEERKRYMEVVGQFLNGKECSVEGIYVRKKE